MCLPWCWSDLSLDVPVQGKETLNMPSISPEHASGARYKLGHVSNPGYVAAVRQNALKLAIISETRVLANCGYETPICQALNQAQNRIPIQDGRRSFQDHVGWAAH
jgi:hypothetical protein